MRTLTESLGLLNQAATSLWQEQRLACGESEAWDTYWLALLSRLQEETAWPRLGFETPHQLQISHFELFSDNHGVDRLVTVLHLEGGVRVVYKPCSVSAEEGFAKLVAHLGLDLKCVRAIDRETYGWLEYIETIPTESDDRPLFARRCGTQLALCCALQSVRMHSGNLLIHGSYPVLIDLETILTPVKSLCVSDPLDAIGRTRLLPVPHDRIMRVGLDRGAAFTQFLSPAWQQEVQSGFSEALEVLAKQPVDLQQFLGQTRFRVNLRSTQDYETLRCLKAAKQSMLLGDNGYRESIHTAEILEAESEVLRSGSHPRFEARAWESGLYLRGRKVSGSEPAGSLLSSHFRSIVQHRQASLERLVQLFSGNASLDSFEQYDPFLSGLSAALLIDSAEYAIEEDVQGIQNQVQTALELWRHPSAARLLERPQNYLGGLLGWGGALFTLQVLHQLSESQEIFQLGQDICELISRQAPICREDASFETGEGGTALAMRYFVTPDTQTERRIKTVRGWLQKRGAADLLWMVELLDAVEDGVVPAPQSTLNSVATYMKLQKDNPQLPNIATLG